MLAMRRSRAEGAGARRPAARDTPAAPLRGLGAGRPLRPSEVPVRALAYGHDFAHVRIHDDAGAHAAAAALDATAFTWGEHIVLSPEIRQDTLAHELAHVVQQRGAGTGMTSTGMTGTSTASAALTGGALERDAELAAASGQPPRLSAVRQVQRQGPLGREGLNPAEQATLSTYLSQHGFFPLGGGLARFDGQVMSSGDIARRAGSEAMQQSIVSLIKKEIDRRIMNAVLWHAPPPVSQSPQTPGQKLEDLFTRKPDGGSSQQLPPSAAPNRDDLNKTTVTPIPGDQSLFKRAGIPAVPSQSPPIPLPQPGRDSTLFRYGQLQDRYATGTGISFQISAPNGFWKQPGVKKVVLQSGGAPAPLATQDIARDGQVISWAAPASPGTYTVLVTVDGQPLSNSARTIQVYAPSASTPSPRVQGP